MLIKHFITSVIEAKEVLREVDYDIIIVSDSTITTVRE
jgi:hypothetical protein